MGKKQCKAFVFRWDHGMCSTCGHEHVTTVTAERAEHEEMGFWAKLPKWAQQELQQWRTDEAFQRGRATTLTADLAAARETVGRLTNERDEARDITAELRDMLVWCTTRRSLRGCTTRLHVEQIAYVRALTDRPDVAALVRK